MLELGAGLGWLGNELRLLRQRQDLLARIGAAGGQVVYEHEGKSGLFQEPPRSENWLRRFYGDEIFAEIEHVIWRRVLPDSADLSVLNELPRLKTLELYGPNVTDEVILQLKSYQKELIELGLSNTSVTSQALLVFPNLRRLSLYGKEVADATLSEIDALNGLESLSLLRTSVTSCGLEPVSRLANLRRLQLMANTQLDAHALELVGRLRKLNELAIGGSSLGDSGLGHLGRLPELRNLELQACNTSDAGMAEIGALRLLERLTLSGSIVTDSGLAELKSLVNLRSLRLGGTQVGDAGMVHLKSLKSLKLLDLGQTQITDAACKHLGQMTQLTMLDIGQTAVTDQGLAELAALINLERLFVSRNVTNAGVEAVRTAVEKARFGKGGSGSLRIGQL